MSNGRVVIDHPAWLSGLVDWDKPLRSAEDRMRLAIRLARANVEQDRAGPFAAIVVENETGRLVSAGVNSVIRLNNSALHGEVVAIMMAQLRLGTYTLAAPGLSPHELITSCEPCAMCLGAALWSGVRSIVCGASREDAVDLGFEEGPVFPESYAYVEGRGIAITRGVLRDEAREVLARYREVGGAVYNP